MELHLPLDVFLVVDIPSPGNSSVIDYVAFATQGDAVDFGDLTSARHAPSGVSNAHGGLG